MATELPPAGGTGVIMPAYANGRAPPAEAPAKPEPETSSLPLDVGPDGLARGTLCISRIAAALARAQAKMSHAAKDSTNPHFKSKYADLAAVTDACRPFLAAEGIGFHHRRLHWIEKERGGVMVETRMLHESGEWIADHCWLPVNDKGPQAYGSAITYAKRYSLASLAGVASDDEAQAKAHGEAALAGLPHGGDDDANAAEGKRGPPPKEAPKRGAAGAKSAIQGKGKPAPVSAPVTAPASTPAPARGPHEREPGEDEGPPTALWGPEPGRLLSELTVAQLTSLEAEGMGFLEKLEGMPDNTNTRVRLAKCSRHLDQLRGELAERAMEAEGPAPVRVAKAKAEEPDIPF